METGKKIRVALIGAAVLVLFGSIGLSAYLFFSNYQNVQLLRQAENNFRQGSEDSLKLAEAQLLQLIRNDSDNERAFVLLGRIARQRKIYPEQVYYTLQAHKLNPLSAENEKAYIDGLLYAREFERLETFLSQKSNLQGELKGYLLYAAGQNGNIGKYRVLLDRRDDNLTAELALLLYKHTHLSDKERLDTLQRYLTLRAGNDFQKQEILAAMVSICLRLNDLDNAEKYLLQACKLNEFAFSPALGRFYANYRSLGKALKVFEKYLAVYHDPAAALQTAEIYCLLKKRDSLAALSRNYQADSGEGAMLLNYYFEVLDKFAANDMASCLQYLTPLQKAVKTLLATFIYLCAELKEENLAGIHKNYNALLAQYSYLDLQMRADRLIIEYVRKSVGTAKAQEPLMLDLAEKVYWRIPESTIGKFVLLSQRNKGNFNLLLLTDLLKRFPKDPGVNKIAVEYYLAHDPAAAEKWIASYMKNFPERHSDMLRYRIVLAVRQNKPDQVSRLFQQNFSPAVAGEYWNFAINHRRIADLRFLARDPQYKPFCEAAILLASGKKAQALEILSKADAKGNQILLLYAARTLAEHDRIPDALARYQKFPENSVYKLDVLLNSSELYWSLGNGAESLRLAAQAYKLAPALPETQFCYADKLYKNGHLAKIAGIVKVGQASPYEEKMKMFTIASLEYQLRHCDPGKEREKLLNISDRLLRIAPGNRIALEYRKKINSLRKKE